MQKVGAGLARAGVEITTELARMCGSFPVPSLGNFDLTTVLKSPFHVAESHCFALRSIYALGVDLLKLPLAFRKAYLASVYSPYEEVLHWLVIRVADWNSHPLAIYI
jgi:hypothetical protein